MKTLIAVGKIYKFGDKIQIYIQADYAELFEEHVNKPCHLVVFIPENEAEELALQKQFARKKQ